MNVRKTKQSQIEKIMYTLFSADLQAEDAEKILHILEYKKLLPLVQTGKGPTLADFLTEFWDWEKSPYVKEKLLHQHSIHQRYVRRCAGAVRGHWIPWFGTELLMSELNRGMIQNFILSFLSHPTVLSAAGRNDVIRSGTVPLKWAFLQGYIDHDVTSGLRYFGGDKPKVMVLDKQTAETVFLHPWHHQKAMMANKLAMLTGLRSGEIQALRGKDIGEDCIYVRHSWNIFDKLKVPKNGEERIVYLPFPQFLSELKQMAGGDDFFVFHNKIPTRPMDPKCWLRELRKELEKLGVDNHIIETIHFHSWRHYFTVHMKKSGFLEKELLQKITGHKTLSMMEYYADHALDKDAEKIKKASYCLFSSLMNM